MFNMEVRCVVVIQKAGLDDEETRKLLNQYGLITETEDQFLDENTPVRLYFIRCNFGQFTSLKLDLNCVHAENNQWILFPMESEAEKRKVLSERGWA